MFCLLRQALSVTRYLSGCPGVFNPSFHILTDKSHFLSCMLSKKSIKKIVHQAFRSVFVLFASGQVFVGALRAMDSLDSLNPRFLGRCGLVSVSASRTQVRPAPSGPHIQMQLLTKETSKAVLIKERVTLTTKTKCHTTRHVDTVSQPCFWCAHSILISTLISHLISAREHVPSREVNISSFAHLA